MDKRQEGQLDACAWQQYDEWLAGHMEELVSRSPSKVVAIHADHIIFIGDAEAEVSQWGHKTL